MNKHTEEQLKQISNEKYPENPLQFSERDNKHVEERADQQSYLGL